MIMMEEPLCGTAGDDTGHDEDHDAADDAGDGDETLAMMLVMETRRW